MSIIDDYLQEKGFLPRISFKKSPVHTVTIISKERRTIKDPNTPGEEVDGIAIKVEEEGEEREIFTSSVSLLQQLADVKDGETVTIKMIKRKTDKGYRTSYEVTEPEIAKVKDEKIPTIEDEE